MRTIWYRCLALGLTVGTTLPSSARLLHLSNQLGQVKTGVSVVVGGGAAVSGGAIAVYKTGVADDVVRGLRTPISRFFGHADDAGILYDSAGRIIVGGSQLWKTVVPEYRIQATKVFNEVLKDVPQHILMSEEKLKSALQKAFTTSTPKRKYSFDVSTGKLKLTCPTSHGEVTGELHVYGLPARVVATGVTVGTLVPTLRAWIDANLKRPEPLSARR